MFVALGLIFDSINSKYFFIYYVKKKSELAVSKELKAYKFETNFRILL
jgi:hypothetical protein